MTNMLCSLANGRVVVALEVFDISHLLRICPRECSIGGLQPRFHLKLGIGGHKGPAGRPTSPTSPALPERSSLGNCLAGWYGAESVLEVYGPESSCSQKRWVYFSCSEWLR